MDQPKSGVSPEMTGYRPATSSDTWRKIRWRDWLMRRQRIVRNYLELVPQPCFVVVEVGAPIIGVPRLATFASYLAFGLLARVLLTGEPVTLLATDGNESDTFAGPGALGQLAEAVARRVGESRNGLSRRRQCAGDLISSIRISNSTVYAIIGAYARVSEVVALARNARSVMLQGRGPTGSDDTGSLGAIFPVLTADEFSTSFLLARSTRTGVLYGPDRRLRKRLASHLDSLVEAGNREGVTVEPLIVQRPEAQVWEVLTDVRFSG